MFQNMICEYIGMYQTHIDSIRDQHRSGTQNIEPWLEH